MAFSCSNISDLVTLLRENGDRILDASSKLSLSATLLFNLNESLGKILKQHKVFQTTFHVIESDRYYDLEFLYDFIQKTIALKILPDASFWNNEQLLDINIFRNLRLLEVQRLSLNLIKGLKSLRAQLQYLTCVRSLRNIGEVLESCGADDSQGFVWRELKEAVFSYNSLNSLDGSLEFAPWLHTLDISHNSIQSAQFINCLPVLRYLNISFNQLESVPSFSGQLCSHLKVLVLSNNFIDNVRELSALINLSELDLSCNCMISHTSLRPLASLSALRRLNLSENPLSFHPRHRSLTSRYLHFNTAHSNFMLEGAPLSKADKQLTGSIRIISATRHHLDSVASTESECTVIPKYNDACVNTDIESSASSVATVYIEPDASEENDNWLKGTLITESIGMQDSGIVTGRRPTSPSEFSIGSATSLASCGRENLRAVHCESDIEILSNPSQSSIEILESSLGQKRYTEPTHTQEIQLCSTKMDLCKKCDKQRRSL